MRPITTGVSWFVCLSVCPSVRETRKSGRTDPDVVCLFDSVWPKEPCILDGGPNSPLAGRGYISGGVRAD